MNNQNAEDPHYPDIRFVDASDIEISINSKLGHEKAMQASIVESISLQHHNQKWQIDQCQSFHLIKL